MNINEETNIVYKFPAEEKDIDLVITIKNYLKGIKDSSIKVDRLLRKKAKHDNKLKDFLNLVDSKKTFYDVEMIGGEMIIYTKKG